jgi:hypothetical protein
MQTWTYNIEDLIVPENWRLWGNLFAPQALKCREGIIIINIHMHWHQLHKIHGLSFDVEKMTQPGTTALT